MVVAGTSMVVPENEVPDEGLYLEKLTQSITNIFGDRIDQKSLKASVAPRTGIPDDLPIIGLNVPSIRNMIVLNPTSHLGLTQSPALGEIAASHASHLLSLGKSPSMGLNLSEYRIDRFQNDIEMLRQQKIKPLTIGQEKK